MDDGPTGTHRQSGGIAMDVCEAIEVDSSMGCYMVGCILLHEVGCSQVQEMQYGGCYNRIIQLLKVLR